VGHIIRQWRETDGAGNFLRKAKQPRPRGMSMSSSGRTMKSAFDDTDPYVLTELGKQFVHYVMTEVPPKLTYESDDAPAGGAQPTSGIEPMGEA